jgi:predicted enzyme related to lactoylglutathione lyase
LFSTVTWWAPAPLRRRHAGFFDCAGTRLFLKEGEPGPESILYFQVPDIKAARADLLTRGAALRRDPHMIHRHADGTEEWMAFFDDPDGRPLAIMAKQPPAG